MQYMMLVDEKTVDETTGRTYSCINKRGLIFLTGDLTLNEADVKRNVSDRDLQDEIMQVYGEWRSEVDQGEMERILKSAVEKGKKARREWLIRREATASGYSHLFQG
jgi:hypothetical protein